MMKLAVLFAAVAATAFAVATFGMLGSYVYLKRKKRR